MPRRLLLVSWLGVGERHGLSCGGSIKALGILERQPADTGTKIARLDKAWVGVLCGIYAWYQAL